MPTCYFLTVCSGSSVDQQSNNVSLFNLVEQINVIPNAPPPPQGVVPLEIHAYWRLAPAEIGQEFEMRFVVVAGTGLETPSDAFKHRAVTERFRTRTMGLPYPPVVGAYGLYVDWRTNAQGQWRREPISWPVIISEAATKPRVTH